MPFLINTLEDRLRYRLGDLLLQNDALQQEVDELKNKLADLEALQEEPGDA